MSKKTRGKLRRDMKRVLANLDERWMGAASREISEHLSELVNTNVGIEVEHVLAWITHFQGEVDLTSFISEQLEYRQVYLPRVKPDRTMSFVAINKDWVQNLETGLFGIPEPGPAFQELYDVSDTLSTVVLVPGLAFDADGGRLGRGKGYYDYFFSQAQMMDAVKVGVGCSLQLLEAIPTDSHDVYMDWICHERGFFRAGEAPKTGE